MSNRFLLVRVFAMLLALSLVTWAQWNKKPYTEWSEKESSKLLNDSPWGQTQTFTDKNNTYLLTNDGQRVFIQEYQAPRNDGLGARFVFPRRVNGKPVITPESGEVLFHSEMGSGSGVNASIPNSGIPSRDASGRTSSDYGFTLNTRYKVRDMMFDGKLEF